MYIDVFQSYRLKNATMKLPTSLAVMPGLTIVEQLGLFGFSSKFVVLLETNFEAES